MSFLAQIDSGIERALNSESTLHGIRVQTMFQLMVANLGKVLLIKHEDAGECYYGSDQPIRVPDFRVVLDDGSAILIETKNQYTSNATAPFRIRNDDLDALIRYSTLLKTPVKIAIYWARWNTWTLSDPKSLEQGKRYSEIKLGLAIRGSEMATLGDIMIATNHPLLLRYQVAMDKPRLVTPDGKILVQISEFQISSAHQPITDKTERNIALYLMMYGKWEASAPTVEVDLEGRPMAILYRSEPEPEQRNPGQGFEIIGTLSSMFSAFYNSLTLKESRVADLFHHDDPAKLLPIIRLDYKGTDLALWRFVLEPNFEDEAAKVTGENIES